MERAPFLRHTSTLNFQPLCFPTPKRESKMKKMLRCPHCRVACVRLDSFKNLRSSGSIECPKCGRPVGLSKGSGLAFLALFLGPSVILAAFAIFLEQFGIVEFADRNLVPPIQMVTLLVLPAIMFPISTRYYYSQFGLTKRQV